MPHIPSSPEAQLEQLRSRDQRYRLGQFFTPEPVADLMAQAIHAVGPETVLDPGVGGGVLLRAVGDGAKLYGLDIDPQAISLARPSFPADCELAEGDFLNPDQWPLSNNRFDAIISNPPYIRHHNLSADHKLLARHYSTCFGQKVSSLSGSYVYFFYEAILRLNQGGRLAFITPSEFLDARYGGALKEVLLAHCELDEVLVLEMDELAFEGVLTTSTITIATKNSTPSRRLRLGEGSLGGVVKRGREIVLESPNPLLPWTPLLPSRAEGIAPLLKGRSALLSDYCRVRRGIATGDNSFFAMTGAQIAEWGIEECFLVPLVVGSKDLPLKGPLDEAFRIEHAGRGGRAFLFYCHQPESELKGTNALGYIKHGLNQGVHKRFNCKIRKPWYSVEQVMPADFFATYMSRARARIVRNHVGARCLTSLLNIWAKPGIDPDSLRPSLEDPINARLLREFGRTYGGGLGKIEPGDLLTLPISPPKGIAPPE